VEEEISQERHDEHARALHGNDIGGGTKREGLERRKILNNDDDRHRYEDQDIPPRPGNLPEKGHSWNEVEKKTPCHEERTDREYVRKTSEDYSDNRRICSENDRSCEYHPRTSAPPVAPAITVEAKETSGDEEDTENTPEGDGPTEEQGSNEERYDAGNPKERFHEGDFRRVERLCHHPRGEGENAEGQQKVELLPRLPPRVIDRRNGPEEKHGAEGELCRSDESTRHAPTHPRKDPEKCVENRSENGIEKPHGR